jgi:NAD(P)-dependent dehydrogenase (short-subunit alcohol dehydrogenase family)
MGFGRRVIVTGTRGIAAALVSALNNPNDRVFAIGGEPEEGSALAQELPQLVGFDPIDLRDEAAVERAFFKANEALGGATDVVSVAGGSGRIFGDGALHTLTREAWEKTLELNLTSVFFTAREAIKIFHELGGGSLILTSSVLATSPSPEHFQTHAYATAKAAINGLVPTLSAAYLPNGIRVNAVAPGLVATKMAARAAQNPVIQEFTKKKQPLAGAQLPVESIVQAYLYLIANKDVTGQVITVDGGWSAVTNV